VSNVQLDHNIRMTAGRGRV